MHRKFQRIFLRCAVALALACVLSRAEDSSSGARVEWPSTAVITLGANDALEFSLILPKTLTENAPESVNPSVELSIPGCVLVLKSARASEWIVQVRGIQPPKENELLKVRWKFAAGSGEITYPGKIVSGMKPLDVVLLMDGSWSMTESDPKRLRVAAVRDFITTARHSNLIGRVAIVQFDSKSVTLQPLTPISENFDPAIARISAVGLTDIDGGIRHSMGIIDAAKSGGAAIVLFTDGNQEPGPYKDAHLIAKQAGVAIHTMTLGRDADRELLRKIAEQTGGSYADAQKDNDIASAYGAIVGRMTRLHTISSGEIGNEKSAAFPVDNSCSALHVAVTAGQAGALKLEFPAEKSWSSGEAANPQYFAEAPTGGETRARWEVKKAKEDEPKGTGLAQFTASARTSLYPLVFRASPLPAAAVEIDANDPLLAVSLFDGEQPVRGAKVEALFEFKIDGAVRRESVTLNDGGAGIYSRAEDALNFIAERRDNLAGILTIVVTGTQKDLPYRRELNARFESRREAPPALLVNGSLDFGTLYAGERASRDLNLRVRGTGGAFAATLTPLPVPFPQAPIQPEQVNRPDAITQELHFVDAPTTLKPKERRALKLEFNILETFAPGDYSGTAHLALSGVDAIDVPWHVKVLPVEFVSDPPRVVVGAIYPGAEFKTKLKIATGGGTMKLASASSPFLSNKPIDSIELNKEGREIELAFKIPERDFPKFTPEIVFNTADGNARARVPLELSITEVKFKPIPVIEFGPVESGEKLVRDVAIEWANNARPPLTPKIKRVLGKAVPPVLEDDSVSMSAPVLKENVWHSTLTIPIPTDMVSRDVDGSFVVEAGPAEQNIAWYARVIKPALRADVTSVDFGRVYPGKKSERKIVLRVDAAHPVEFTASVATFVKPKVAGIELAANSVTFNKTESIENAQPFELALKFALPDNAQDGAYASTLTLQTRVGNVQIPLSVKAVDVIDAAAFTLSPTEIVFRITEGESLPRKSFTISSHDDEPLAIVANVPAKQVLVAEPTGEQGSKGAGENARAPKSVAHLFVNEEASTTSNAAELANTLNVTLPARGTVTVFTRPRMDAIDGETGSIHVDGGGEHQEISLRAERYAAPATSVAPEPPKLLNYILSFFVLLLIIAALLVRFFVKKAGIRYVCYAVFVHLGVFSMAMPQQTLVEMLPESVEVTLLDAQESLGMQLTNTQARRLEALHGGGSDDKRGPIAQPLSSPNAGTNGPIDLPAPTAGPASPQPGPVNLEAARGVEKPVKYEAVPEPARGSRDAPIIDDKPLAIDDKTPLMKEKPAPAEQVSPTPPRLAVEATVPALRPSNVTTAETAVVANLAPTAEVPASAPRSPVVLPAMKREAVTEVAATVTPIETAPVSRRTNSRTEDTAVRSDDDAPLAFDNLPAAVPQVKLNPKVTPEETPRAVVVSSTAVGQGSPGLGTIGAELTKLDAAPGAPGLPGDAPGEHFVAMAKTSSVPALGSAAGFGGDGFSGSNPSAGLAATDTGIGSGLGRAGGGLPGGGDEPVAIGTDGGDGPGRAAGGGAGTGSNGGRGSGNGNSVIGGLNSGNNKPGNGGGGENGGGGSGRKAVTGGGGLGGTGNGFATGGGGLGGADIGMVNGKGEEWHGRPGGGGKGISLAPGPSAASLEGFGNGNGAGGNGAGGNGTGNGVGGSPGGSRNGIAGGTGGAPNGTGFGPGGRVPGFGNADGGPGGFGDAPFAVGPMGGGGTKDKGTGTASGGGNPGGKGGGGGTAVGRPGVAGGNSLNGSGGGGGTGFGGIGMEGLGIGGGGRPGGKGGVALAKGPGLKDLEDNSGGRLAKAEGIIAGAPHRGITSPSTGGLIRINIGLAKHSGDWDSSPTALKFLRSAFIERSGLPEVEVNIPTVQLHDLASMLKCRTIMITSNVPVEFKPDEIAGMREYIKHGGTIWVNDSSASDYEKFDEAFRKQVPWIVPGAQLERLEPDHDFYISCYDLSQGYKGFRVPPGDKYRQDYLEAAFMPEAKVANDVEELEARKHRRAGIIYTRNDYADGMEIDPRMNAGMKSLTDLTNAEMLEASLRFGMNWIAYSMGSQGLKLPPPPETIAEFEKVYRYKGPKLPVLDDFQTMMDQYNKPIWQPEKDWCNETAMHFTLGQNAKADLLQVTCTGGTKFKSAVTRFMPCDLSGTRALVFDLNSSLAQGLNVSLLFNTKDGKAYESRAVFVRPGWNRGLRFPLDMGDMKSSASKVPWQAYDTSFEPRKEVERMTILMYNLNESGTIQIGPLYQQK